MSTPEHPNALVHPKALPKELYPIVSTLTSIRKTRGMTQAELAQHAGLSRMTVQRLERNGLDPRLSTLQEMARVLEQQMVVIPVHLHAAFNEWLKQQHAV